MYYTVLYIILYFICIMYCRTLALGDAWPNPVLGPEMVRSKRVLSWSKLSTIPTGVCLCLPMPHFAPAPIDLISIGTTPDLVLYMEHAMLRV